ncbi:hypothetical protein Nans01_30290 [Nocardiopsis ansamitocini]|uniref:Uncharacterized protein n=1 Tax=Nocardiopsis ansamitocini TaxID=1670832 RepID=A0A9W6UJM7_9ACTN|nr:hypothetical protein Nans01_30290 [Nocardiopsis ansamitocini]
MVVLGSDHDEGFGLIELRGQDRQHLGSWRLGGTRQLVRQLEVEKVYEADLEVAALFGLLREPLCHGGTEAALPDAGTDNCQSERIRHAFPNGC